MKKLLLLLSLLFVACSNDTDSITNTSSMTPSEIRTALNGTWHLDVYRYVTPDGEPDVDDWNFDEYIEVDSETDEAYFVYKGTYTAPYLDDDFRIYVVEPPETSYVELRGKMISTTEFEGKFTGSTSPVDRIRDKYYRVHATKK